MENLFSSLFISVRLCAIPVSMKSCGGKILQADLDVVCFFNATRLSLAENLFFLLIFMKKNERNLVFSSLSGDGLVDEMQQAER